MTEISPESLATPPDERKLQILLEKSEKEIGKLNLVPVAEAGFIVWNDRLRPMAGNDWVLFDYDDTLVAYTEVKRQQLALYHEYLQKELGVDLSIEGTEKVLKICDEFARWKAPPEESEHYHVNAHMAALTWASEQLAEARVAPLRAIGTIQTDLTRMKQQLQGSGTDRLPDDPFHFARGRLILHSKKPWDERIERIFQQTVINPPVYPETIGAIKESGGPKSSIFRFNVGIFTYGDPYFQLLKVTKLLKDNPDLPISQIWLAEVPKGEFVKKLVETKAELATKLEYVPAELEDYPGEALSPPSGYPLGETPHTLILFDDDPKQLSNILSLNELLAQRTRAVFTVVRSKRQGTKTQRHDWHVITPYGEVDFTSQQFVSRDVANIFLINRFLAMKANRPKDDPRILRMKEELSHRGVNIQEIESHQ